MSRWRSSIVEQEQQKDYLSDGEREVQYVYTHIPNVHSHSRAYPRALVYHSIP